MLYEKHGVRRHVGELRAIESKSDTTMKQQIIDSKANPSTTGEADDCLFEYLHAELVNYVLSRSSNTAVSN